MSEKNLLVIIGCLTIVVNNFIIFYQSYLFSEKTFSERKVVGSGTTWGNFHPKLGKQKEKKKKKKNPPWKKFLYFFKKSYPKQTFYIFLKKLYGPISGRYNKKMFDTQTVFIFFISCILEKIFLYSSSKRSLYRSQPYWCFFSFSSLEHFGNFCEPLLEDFLVFFFYDSYLSFLYI